MQTPARHEMTELSVDQCLGLLATQPVGRLVYHDGGRVEVRPVNFTVHRGSVVFRTAHGHLLDVVHRSGVVFEADHADPATRSGWSVIVRGTAEEIWRTEELAVVRDTGLRPWAAGDRDHYVRIISHSITGRRVV